MQYSFGTDGDRDAVYTKIQTSWRVTAPCSVSCHVVKDKRTNVNQILQFLLYSSSLSVALTWQVTVEACGVGLTTVKRIDHDGKSK